MTDGWRLPRWLSVRPSRQPQPKTLRPKYTKAGYPKGSYGLVISFSSGAESRTEERGLNPRHNSLLWMLAPTSGGTGGGLRSGPRDPESPCSTDSQGERSGSIGRTAKFAKKNRNESKPWFRALDRMEFLPTEFHPAFRAPDRRQPVGASPRDRAGTGALSHAVRVWRGRRKVQHMPLVRVAPNLTVPLERLLARCGCHTKMTCCVAAQK